MIEINSISRIAIRQLAAVLFLAAISSLVVSATEPGVHVVVGERGTEPPGRHVTRDLNGVLTTGENLTLKLNTDLGSLRIVPLQPGAPPVVRYSVHLETDARGEAAAQLLDRYAFNAKSTPAGAEITGNLPQLSRGNGGAQFWVHYEIAVPASYSLDVTTGAGDIQTFDVGGTATLVTEGGNIVGGRIGTNFIRGQGARGRGNVTRLVGKLQTQGGHIQVDDVAGDLTAFTAGGHINTGRIFGEANLQSGGGHIRSAAIDGRAELATEGGNITVGKAEKLVTVKTGGGQIDFGEVRGSVRAQTGGGGIRVMYVAGPMDVESSGGSICLTRVSGSVRAATDSGTITAWINPEAERHSETVNLPGASQLTSGEGDIVVFLPKNLAANIEAIVENGGARRIEADPALALQIAKVSQSSGAVKAWTTLNGGGAVLKLKTTGGKIKLQYSDSEMALWDSMMRDQSARMERELTRAALALPARPGEPPAPWPTPQISVAPPAPVAAKANPRPAAAPEPSDVWNGSWVERMEVRLIGGVRMDADEFWTRVTRHPDPVYPEVARKGGIEGTVRLQVRLTQDGKIEVQKLLEGDTVLADAAMAAVKQWRGKPMWTADGKPVDVVSTITFRFKLRD